MDNARMTNVTLLLERNRFIYEHHRDLVSNRIYIFTILANKPRFHCFRNWFSSAITNLAVFDLLIQFTNQFGIGYLQGLTRFRAT